jgi:hypothetical protein
VRRLLQTGEQLRIHSCNAAPAPGFEAGDPKINVIVRSRDRAELLGLALRSVPPKDFHRVGDRAVRQKVRRPTELGAQMCPITA